MRRSFILLAFLVSGCASLEHDRNLTDNPRRASLDNVEAGVPPPSHDIDPWLGAARPPDELVLFDSRALRRLREQEIGEQLSLTGGAKIGLWVGLGVGAIWLYNEIKDTTEDFIDCFLPLDSGQCRAE